MTPNESSIKETLRQDGQFLLLLALSLASDIADAGAMLYTAQTQGHNVSVCGNRTSGALTAAADMPYDVYLPPGHSGDLMLIVMPDKPTDDLFGVISAGRERGLFALALVSDASLGLAAYADCSVHVPTSDPGTARIAMVAVLRAITESAAWLSREALAS